MKKTSLLLLSFLISSTTFLSIPSFSAEEKDILLKEETALEIVLNKSISSSNSAIGQPIEAEIAEDIIIDDRIVIAKGSAVKGSISAVERAKRIGKGGNISLQISSVRAVDEQKVSLRSGLGRNGSDKTGKTVAMTVIFGLPGLLVKGREAGIVKGTKIKAFVDDDIKIKSSLIPEPKPETINEENKTKNKK
jgi:hypothetical protein